MTRVPRRVSCAVLASLFAFSVAACAGGGTEGQTPGVTDTKIVLGSHQPLTGPISAAYAKGPAAVKAYFNYVNAHGGVHGRKITFKYLDDGYNPATTQQVVRQLILQDKVFAVVGGLGTPTHLGVVGFLNAHKVPDLFVASGSVDFNQPTRYPETFRYLPSYVAEGKVMANYIKMTYPGKRVCHLGQNDDFGRDSLTGVRKILGSHGVVQAQKYDPSDTSLGPQIGSFRAARCDVVILESVTPVTARALVEAARQNYRPAFVTSWVADPAVLGNLLGAQKNLMSGIVGVGFLPVADTDPWVKLFKKINAQYNKGVKFDTVVERYMSMAYDIVQTLQRNGRKLTRESIIATLEKGGFQGPAFGPYGYSKTNHAGPTGFRLAKLTGSSVKYFTPTYTADDGDGPVAEYTGPQASPAANGIPTG